MKTSLRRVALASVLTVAVCVAGAVPGAAASEPSTARDGAVEVQRLHDELSKAAAADDMPAMRWTLDELTPLLADLRGGERYTVENLDAVADTSAEATTVKERITTLLPQRAELSSFPELLNLLLQQLLKLLGNLVNSLLGGGVPLPM